MDQIALAGRKALIVGAYRGMGRAVARALAGEDVSCALMDRDGEKLAEVAGGCAEAGRAAFPGICDIARMETIGPVVHPGVGCLRG